MGVVAHSPRGWTRFGRFSNGFLTPLRQTVGFSTKKTLPKTALNSHFRDGIVAVRFRFGVVRGVVWGCRGGVCGGVRRLFLTSLGWGGKLMRSKLMLMVWGVRLMNSKLTFNGLKLSTNELKTYFNTLWLSTHDIQRDK